MRSLLKSLWRPVRRVLVWIRDTCDRILHPTRRRRAMKRLGDLFRAPGSVRSVLFVCLGNVCRSPYAEWSFRESLPRGGEWRVESAGFIGPGRSPPETAVDVALERGIDHRDNVSRVIDTRTLERAGVVFVFDKGNARRLRRIEAGASPPVFLLGDFDPVWDSKRAIIDPWGRSIDEFRRVFARIDRCLESVRAALDSAGGPDADSSPGG